MVSYRPVQALRLLLIGVLLSSATGPWPAVAASPEATRPPGIRTAVTDPALVAPADGAVVHLPITLEWTTMVGWQSFLIVVDDNGDFSSPLVSKIVEEQARTFTLSEAAVEPGRRYYWRVGGVGKTMAWSETHSFYVVPPPPPDLEAPVDGAEVDLMPTLSWAPVWQASGAAIRYLVHIGQGPGFTLVHRSPWTTETSYTVPGGWLQPGQTYRWRVRSMMRHEGQRLLSPWSGLRDFTATAIASPPEVVLTAPAEGALDLVQPFSLQFELAAGSSPVVGFVFEVATDAGFHNVVLAGDSDDLGGAGQGTVRGLAHGVRHHWRAAGFTRDAAGNKVVGPWAGPRSFTTLPLPGAVHLQGPRPGAASQRIDPVLMWFAATRADRYVMHLARTPGDLDLPGRRLYTVGEDASNPHTATVYAVPITDGLLDYRTQYVWRVKAVNAAGDGPWSPVWSFTTGVGFSGPANLAPVDGKTSVNLPKTLSWSKPPGAPSPDYYMVHFAYDREFRGSAWDERSSGRSYRLPAAHGKRWHYWRVRGHYNADDSYTEWSDTLRFRTRPEAPPRTAPATLAQMVPLPVTLRWETPPDPDDYGSGYVYQVRITEPGTSDPLDFDGVTQESLTVHPDARIHYGQCYAWRLRVKSTDPGAPPEPASLWSRAQSVCFDVYPSPPLVWPDDGETVWDTWFPLRWDPLGQEDLPAPFGVMPTHYDVQVGTQPDLDDPAHVVYAWEVALTDPQTPPQPVVSYTPGPLQENTAYWWRVRARFEADGPGTWSAVRQVHTNPVVGTPPVLLSPADGAPNQSRTPSLSWSMAPGALRHVVVVQRDGAIVWSKDLFTSGQTGTYTQVVEEPLAFATTYTWRVQAYATGSSAWSEETWRFTTTDEPLPATPVLQAPADGQQQVALPVELAWTAVVGAAGYHLQVVAADPGRFPGGPYVVNDPAVPPVGSTLLTTLAPGQRYWWRLCARNASGICGGWSQRSFVTEGPATMAAPTLLQPDPATPTPLQPTFLWSEVPGAASYEWHLGDDSTPGTFGALLAAAELPGMQHTHDHALAARQGYTWRVRARDALGRNGPWSAVGSFATAAAGPPSVPVLETPGDQTSGHPGTVVLAWGPVTGATYDLQLAADTPDFSGPLVHTATGLTGLFEEVGGLSAGHAYYWRVRACTVSSCSAYTAAWLFYVGTPQIARYYYLKDHLGSVRMTVNDAGAVVHTDDYYPFGLRMPGRSYVVGTPTPERFTGHELDDETEQYYAGVRYYDPVVARWTGVDPLAEKHPDWTPYNYVLANPLVLVDPDGRQEAYYNRDREERLLNPATREAARQELQELRPVGEALLGSISDAADIALTVADAYENGLSWRHGLALLPLVSFGMVRAGGNIAEAAGDAARAADGGLASMLRDYAPGKNTVFSGVFDPSSGALQVQPSGKAIYRDGSTPPDLVPRRVGHAKVNASLSKLTGADPGQTVAFTIFFEEQGVLKIAFRSSSVNFRNHGARLAPEEFQKQIIDILEQTTGYTVLK